MMSLRKSNQEEEKSRGDDGVASVYIKSAIVFRAHRYEAIGMDNLNSRNDDYFEIKKKLNKIGYKPLDCMADKGHQEKAYIQQLQISIANLFDSSKHNQNNQKDHYNVNLLFLQGHGGLHKQDPCLIIPDHNRPGKLRLLNVTNLAKKFAKLKKTMTIIFFDACRVNLDQHDNHHLFAQAIQDDPLFHYEPLTSVDTYPGYSTIVYSCKQWQTLPEQFDEKKTYNQQEKGHTDGAKHLFEAFEQGCRTFKEFKNNIIKGRFNEFIPITYNEQDSNIYLSLNIFGNEQQEIQSSMILKKPEREEEKLNSESNVQQVAEMIQKSIKKGKYTDFQLPQNSNSLNFIVKEHNQGFVYAGCMMEKVIYILDPLTQSLSSFQTKTNHLLYCAELLLNDTMLALGASEEQLIFYNLQNPASPSLKKCLPLQQNPNQTPNLTCLKALNQQMVICGQELGYLTIVNYLDIEIISKLHLKQNQNSHVNTIARTPDPSILLIGTNQGIYQVKIDQENFSMSPQSYFYDEKDLKQIKTIAYLENQLVLFSSEGQEKLNIFDYNEGKIKFQFDVNSKPQKLISVNDVIRQSMQDEEEKSRSVMIQAFPSKFFILQSDKSLSLMHLETQEKLEMKEILLVNHPYLGLNFEYNLKDKKVSIYTNEREGRNRKIHVITIPLN